MNNKLSVVLAVRNEEENIGRCLEAVKNIADEIVIFDEHSTDKTVEICKKYGAKIFEEPHHENFHITKQKAIDTATGDWVLQLDADEVVTPQLAEEIKSLINMTNEEIKKRNLKDKNKKKLFLKHQQMIGKRDNLNFENGEIVAFMIPRLNMFLGKPLKYAGVYPDPAIRLFKNGKAYLPGGSVHEIMKVDGMVAWTFNDMQHFDSPTLKRYLDRANRYTSFTAAKFAEKRTKKNLENFIFYTAIKPISTFLMLYFRYKGFKDGINGFLWSLFSGWHFPLSYYKYITGGYNQL
ncbi:glycosyltransferase family 2 protein [Candidatus Microgenomates bacterium]|nr:glycosyltransferase family 2 protein [Candidatus Microgenomates bacterium]